MQRQRLTKAVVSAVAFFILMSLAACNRVELYGNLSEEDANEMLVLLSDNDIRAQKKKEVQQNEIFYSIVVSSGDISRARTLLVQHKLPRRRQLGLTGVYKEKGLIPTPDEQKARFLLALKGEIINSLERIPDVVDVDAVLNIPSVDEFADPETKKLKRPTASVVIKVKPEAVTSQILNEAKIQQFVANAVEGLNPRDITVIISYLPVKGATMRPGDVVSLAPEISHTPAMPQPEVAAPPSYTETLAGLNLDVPSKAKLKVYLLVFFLILLLLSTVLILAIIKGSRMRREMDRLRSAGGQGAVEGEVLSEGPRRLGVPPSDTSMQGSPEGHQDEVYEEEPPDDEDRM